MVSHLATAILAVTMVAAKAQPPQWESDYGKALESTRAEAKPLLVVLDKPADAESRLDPELLSEDAISGQERKLLRPYELCHVDVSTKYGKRVAKAFQAKDFPYMAIIDKTGSEVIFSKAGKIQQGQWAKTLLAHTKGTRGGRVSHVSYKPSDESLGFKSPSDPSDDDSYCPSCQRKARRHR